MIPHRARLSDSQKHGVHADLWPKHTTFHTAPSLAHHDENSLQW